MSVEKLITENLELWTGAVTQKNASGRGSSSKRELTGIKKLRELILELAVRGKLVSQDASEEPAEALLGRIEVEKEKLLKAGEIKRSKKLPPINPDESLGLPASWLSARLGEITNYGATVKAESSDVSGDTWVLELEDIEKESSRLLNRVTFADREFRSSKNRFKAGDVLYGKLRPYLDKVLVADDEGVCTTEIIPIRLYGGISPGYMRVVLKSPQFKTYANDSTHGMNLPRLGTDKARLAVVPLAPVAEQHRIVQKVDELMALCDQLEQQTGDQIEAHERLVDTLLDTLTRAANATELAENWARVQQHFDTLFTTEHSIDRLKQTILQLAVMGRLVPQNPTDEPASALLKKISDRREILIAQNAIRKAKPVEPVGGDELGFHLPAGWESVRFAQIAFQITDGAHHTPIYRKEGVPFLSVKDMSSGQLDFSDTRFISHETHSELIKRCNPQKGDLLLTKVGTTGIPILIETDKSFSIFVSVALIKFDTSNVDGEFLKLLMGSPFVKAQSEAGTEGVGNKNLVLRKIANFVLVLPPLAEQRRIVRRVARLLSVCNQLLASVGNAGELANQLSAAVVEQAIH